MKKRSRTLTLALAALTAVAVAWPTTSSARDPIASGIIQMNGTTVPTARTRDHRSPARTGRRVDHRRIRVDHRSRDRHRVGHTDIIHMSGTTQPNRVVRRPRDLRNIARSDHRIRNRDHAVRADIIQMNGATVPTARTRDHRSPVRTGRRVDHRRIRVDHRSRDRHRVGHPGIVHMSGTTQPSRVVRDQRAARSRDHRGRDHRNLARSDHRIRNRHRVAHSDRRVDHRTAVRASRRTATGRSSFGPSASVLARPGLSLDSSCSCWDGIGACKKSGGKCVATGGDLGCTGVCAVEDPEGFTRSAR
jgi:hypothetical protein